ncbi:hypothetical protein RDV84_22335 [Lysobacter yananisis]|uniref:Transmembrane protein n=1 Tax=Lysobacter yananisis TaxID=1003114 RepID=A0ABY9P6P1_9GAMM|nr:hypothetical protein [Lysobacter yananisis]WMT02672.1 hypothetical protein RDV84_22335 [Lysobacter yananisis]
MPEPIYLLILAAWSPPLILALARLGFGRHGVIVHALALAATLAVVYAALRLCLAPLREPGTEQAFASVDTIVRQVDYWWAVYLFEQAWPALAAGYFVVCWLLALPFALRLRRQRIAAAPRET